MAIVAIALAFRDYKAKDGKFIDIMVIEDSSQQPMHTDIEALLALYRFYLDLGQRAVFRLNVITGSRITSPKEAAIGNGAESIAQNAHGLFDLRFRQIEGFFNNVTGILAEHLESTGTAKPHKYNEVFRTIANDLNIFSTGTATEQIMLVHSSLREQSDLFSCTSDEDLGLLYSSPKEVAARFETAVKIGKLNRVKVIFVYAPIDEDDERFFLQMVDVYRYILTPLGAQVSIQSSAKTYGI
ncbi:hypothetical protein CJD36_004530 [Flavipsychrobacter stenotrophus]|uniref:Uncharacterized protein n=2 Tax=Flavipsychrobacter stenotrophus TaxID=2077091 RepID=A0A2S7T2J4_9BACT|nr:hypothetical protein CJD36_004530 [Flavipsychrobacter stenotrophus]